MTYQSRKLNLGSGAYKLEGYVNVDHLELFKPDVVMNLNDLQAYRTFEDSSFDEIIMSHVLEHLDRPFDIMRELHRILAPGGKLIIEVPHFSRGFTHAEHAKGFDVTFPYYFDRRFLAGYLGFTFDLVEMKLSWMIRFDIKEQVVKSGILSGLAKGVNAVISFFANLNPYLCSRIWCYWVGGFEQLRFVFMKPKE